MGCCAIPQREVLRLRCAITKEGSIPLTVYILTFDVGTSSTKTALWSGSGQLVAEASYAYAVYRPDPLRAEMDPEDWWRAIATTARQVLAQSGVTADQVVGIGVDGISWTLVPVDQAVRPLFPALTWLDRRAIEESDALAGLPDAQRLVRLDANPLDPAYITPKLVWLKKNHPDIFEHTFKFLTSTGFIVARLTGEWTCDWTQAYGFHCFDMERACWDAWAADQIGVPLDRLPELVAPYQVVGPLTAAAAEATGLRAGTTVIAGGLDAAFGALGSGVTRPGQTNEQGGQAGGMGISMDHVVVEPRLIFSHHVLPGQYLLQAGTVGGGSLGWFRDVLGDEEIRQAAAVGCSPFELFTHQVLATPPGAHGVLFLPYMAGERTPLWNNQARGVFFGLSYATGRGDLLRAIMEGCAFAVYDNLRIAEEKGAHVTEWLGSGGATQSSAWCQIKADISNRPFVVARLADGREGGHSLGLFALTACAAGLDDQPGHLVERLLVQRQEYMPSPAHHAMYEDLFGVYLKLSRKLLEDFRSLDHVVKRHSLYQEFKNLISPFPSGFKGGQAPFTHPPAPRPQGRGKEF